MESTLSGASLYRILHTETSEGWGGQEIRVFREMEAMRERGHTLFLAAPAKSKIYQKSREAGFEVYDLKESKPRYPSTILKFAQYLRRNQIQIVNTHSSRDGWIGGIAARLARTPLIIRSRHIEVDYPNRFTSWIGFGILPHLVFTTSQRITDRLIQELSLQWDRVATLPTGIDPKKFHAKIPPHLREIESVPAQNPLIAMISVLRSWKGHDVFLNAVEILQKQGVQATYWIVGGGPGERHLQQQIESRSLPIRMLGHREDIPEILAAIDILVLPSTGHEGVPQIILQAQACQKAVIGSQVGGIPEVIEHQVSGLLVEKADPDALARAMKQLIQSPELRRELAEEGHSAFQKKHTIQTMCEKVETHYQRFLKLES
jgi:glycosyltransferase involved in cell wall biosynthesis